MTKEELIEQIEGFIPSNEEEKADKEVILHALKTEENIFSRENQICHVTSSCWTKSFFAITRFFSHGAGLVGIMTGKSIA